MENYEREKRNRNPERGMNRRTEKNDQIYEENKFIPRKVETAPSYNRAPWMIDEEKCLDFIMCSITKRASRERIVAEHWRASG
jgi:hypothetical protein